MEVAYVDKNVDQQREGRGVTVSAAGRQRWGKDDGRCRGQQLGDRGVSCRSPTVGKKGVADLWGVKNGVADESLRNLAMAAAAQGEDHGDWNSGGKRGVVTCELQHHN